MKNGKSQLVAIVLAVVIAFTCGLGGGIGAMYLVNNNIIKVPGLSAATIYVPKEVQKIDIDLTKDLSVGEAIAAKVLPSVVGISTVSTATMNDSLGLGGLWFFGGGGGGYTYDTTSVGTGVIVDEAGYILTNSHVVNDGDTKSITVSLFDGRNIEGIVLWNEPSLDLAVVKVNADNLVAAEIGDSDTMNIGSYAAAIGNPLGLDFERSMSQGIISGLDRTITVGNGSSSSATTMEGLMQTDATINSGNSGGPLLNAKGQVVGINSAKASNGEGMGFAIPINVTKPIIAQVKETGTFVRPYIGVSGASLGDQSNYSSAQLVEFFGTASGIYVQAVTPGYGAEKAGIKQGDIIIKMDDTYVGTMNKLNSLLIEKKAGDEVELTVLRDKKEQTFKVTLINKQENMQ